MKCSKCSKVFDADDLNLDNRRLSARVGPPPPKHLPRQVPHLGPGSGEFKPLCAGCYKGSSTAEALPTKTHTPQCDKCNVEVVNGVPTHEEGCPNSRKTWKYGHYRGGEDDVEENANVIADLYLGETVVTNDRVLNDVLRHAGDIIGRRDVSPIDKFETLFAYLLKARREVLGAVDV